MSLWKRAAPDKIESLREINSSEVRLRVRLGFVKLIRNGLRKEQNLIQSRPFIAETSQAERENEIRLQKEV